MDHAQTIVTPTLAGPNIDINGAPWWCPCWLGPQPLRVGCLTVASEQADTASCSVHHVQVAGTVHTAPPAACAPQLGLLPLGPWPTTWPSPHWQAAALCCPAGWCSNRSHYAACEPFNTSFNLPWHGLYTPTLAGCCTFALRQEGRGVPHASSCDILMVQPF